MNLATLVCVLCLFTPSSQARTNSSGKAISKYEIEIAPLRHSIPKHGPITVTVLLRNVGNTPIYTHPYLLGAADITFLVQDAHGRVMPLRQIGFSPGSLEFLEGSVASAIESKWPLITPGAFVGATLEIPADLPTGKYSVRAIYRLWTRDSWDKQTLSALHSLKYPLPMEEKRSPAAILEVH
jgi:hypothetical protein